MRNFLFSEYEKKLPIKISSYSSCFRAEAGAAGRENKALTRIFNFLKYFNLKEIKDLKEVCLFMSQKITQNTFVVVCGEIGSGKTTFIKNFFSFLGVEENVNSPTFNVMKRYWSKKLSCFLNHFDFFMLKNEEDCLIFEEFKNESISFAEWGDKTKSFWIKEKNVFYLKIKAFSDNSREFIIWNSINKK